MMDDCKKKIKSMQKYVPLLSKLIKQLEEIIQITPESAERINQLKTLYQQLSDPKPGIPLDELKKCENVLENLFEISDDKKDFSADEAMPESDEETEKTSHVDNLIHEDKDTVDEVSTSEECSLNQGESTEKNIKKSERVAEDDNEKTPTPSNLSSMQGQEIKNTADQKSNSIDSNKYYRSKTEEDVRKLKNTEKCNEKESDLEESIEIIEFIENENGFHFTELILPDDENPLVDHTFEQNDENHDLQTKELEDDVESSQDLESINEKSDNSEKEQTEKNAENIQNITEVSVEHKVDKNLKSAQFLEHVKNKKDGLEEELIEKNTESIYIIEGIPGVYKPIEQSKCEDDPRNAENVEKLLKEQKQNELIEEKERTNTTTINEKINVENNTVNTSSSNDPIQNGKKLNDDKNITADKNTATYNGQKRVLNECIEDLEAKKQRSSIMNNDNNQYSSDPLAVGVGIYTDTVKNGVHYINTVEKADDNDDVEIIEDRNSPILIESDDDDVEIIKHFPKKPIRKPAYASKSTNLNKIRNSKLYQEVVYRYKHNFGSTNQKMNPNKATEIENSKPVLTTNPIQKNIKQTNFLSKIDLQPSSVPQTNSNPRLFKANLGAKSILIPNAFYGNSSHMQKTTSTTPTTQKEGEQQKQQQQIEVLQQNMASKTVHRLPSSNPQVSSSSSDEAHCRWLNNFLNHFCTPRNIAHNTCYLLLKRALRQNDFERVRLQRLAMKQTTSGLNFSLLSQLRKIFYVNGNHLKQKLSLTGRTFCNLAFVNILDKTISLTTDSVTNIVTSRTRISEAALDAARLAIQYSKNAATKLATSTLTQNENEFINHRRQTTTTTTTQLNSYLFTQNTSQSSFSLRSRDKDDLEYCPPRELLGEFVESSSSSPPRRSLRTSLRRQGSNENSNTFTYNEIDDEDNNIFNLEPHHQEHEKREKPILTPATEAYITQKRLAAIQERQKQAKLFETTFGEKISCNSSKENAASDVYIISDDDDDNDGGIDTLEPRPHLIYKNIAIGDNNQAITIDHAITDKNLHDNEKIESKNISSAAHSMSIYKDRCLLCSQRFPSVVAHYVNTHPNSEVFISRPSPEMVQTILNNQLSPGEYDCTQRGQRFYIATCIFCEKKASFSLSYWYHHFATHTGEYAYRCSGCGIRKPMRTQLASHIRQNCPMNGLLEITEIYDLSVNIIMGYLCRLCNFTQLNPRNVYDHLQNEHQLAIVENSHWVAVPLLDLSQPSRDAERMQNTIYVQGENNDIFEIAEIDDTGYTEGNSNQPFVINEAELNNDWRDVGQATGMYRT